MLGKCIKNEFVNRWRTVAAAFVGILLGSLLVCGMTLLADNRVIDSAYFRAFVRITVVLYALVFIASIFGLLLLPMTDFAKRFFKDQGYLTHTLPVKTSTLLLARMVGDIAMVACMGIVYPFAISIAARDFSFYDDLIGGISHWFALNGTPMERAGIVMAVVMTIIGIFLSSLFSIWTFNSAYAFGHSFNKGKRLISVISYIVLIFIFQSLMMIFNMILEIPEVGDAVRRIANGIDTEVGAYLTVVTVLDVVMLAGVALLAVITNRICKNHLNLE